MRKILITEDLYQYQFPPRPDQHFGFNIFTLIHGKEALLIDTGFEDHALAVKEDLAKDGIKPTYIIISHFHDDHIFGLQTLENLHVFGSEFFQVSLDQYTLKEMHAIFKPTNMITETSKIKFGNFDIQFLLIPGHAICGIYTIINNQFVHIGDDIMCSNDDVPLLPSVELDRVSEHIASLEKLKEYMFYTLLLGHGNSMSGNKLISKEIDDRLKYLKAVFTSEKPTSYDEAVKECSCDFLHKEWHDYLYE